MFKLFYNWKFSELEKTRQIVDFDPALCGDVEEESMGMKFDALNEPLCLWKGARGLTRW